MSDPSPVQEAWAAVRAVRVPFVAIQLAMLAVAGAYAVSSGFRESLQGLAEFRERGGFLFSAAGMVLAGVLVPELARKLSGLRSEITNRRLLLLYVVYFAALGALVAGLQDGMTVVLGDAQDLGGITARIVFDQAIFSPILTMPLAAGVFAWRDAEFRLAGIAEQLRSGELKRRYVRLLVTCWFFWIPVLVAVYAVPLLLQFPLALIAEAAWALLMLALERRTAPLAAGVPA